MHTEGEKGEVKGKEEEEYIMRGKRERGKENTYKWGEGKKEYIKRRERVRWRNKCKRRNWRGRKGEIKYRGVKGERRKGEEYIDRGRRRRER